VPPFLCAVKEMGVQSNENGGFCGTIAICQG